MPRSATLVPDDTHRDIYLVLDDFGPRLGRRGVRPTKMELTARQWSAT
jgi:hypothetical protein